jgi:outer membrane protein insertion porin family
MMKKYIMCGILAGTLCHLPAVFAADTLKIEAIEVKGIKRLSAGTVLNYLPLKEGDTFESARSSYYINELYKSGFFDDVRFAQRGHTLIVQVVERPTITNIRISGNHEIERKKIEETLKTVGLTDGQILNPSLLERTRTAIVQQYMNLGYYGAEVDAKMTSLPENRVTIVLKIHEGALTKIRDIKIIGNQHFRERKLLKVFHLGPSNIFSYFTNNDRYSKPKLSGDIEVLRSFYLDRGYVKFQVDSTQVSLTPDKKGLYITLHVTEGDVYRIQEIKLEGNMAVPKEELEALIKVKTGDIFSRKKIMESNSAMANDLGNHGYANAAVHIGTKFDDEHKTVTLILTADPGKLVYVRRISFAGNIKTQDEVLRRQVRQPEGGLVNLDAIQESARRLRLLEYFKDVKVTTAQVPGTDDQMDVGFTLTETPSARASVGVGYSSDGLLFNVNFNQDNFLGSGKTVGFDFSNDKFNRVISAVYNNPYYRPNGVSRGFSAYVEKTTPGRVNVASYTTDQYGAAVNYGVPLTEDDRITFGYGFDHTELSIGNDTAFELQQFKRKYGTEFNQVLLTAGWSHNGLDQAIFPTKGFVHGVSGVFSAPIGDEGLDYYKLSYRAQYYLPMWYDFILMMRTSLGYGDGYGDQKQLPFFKNYYAGGIGSVRGYRSNSLGPRDSKGDPMGGNLLVTGTMGVIVPQPFSEDVRTSVFVDAGNVFNTHANVVRKTRQEIKNHIPTTEGKFSASEIRTSAGIQVDWRSPMGPLVFSLAAPLNARSGDEKEVFQFTIGTSF